MSAAHLKIHWLFSIPSAGCPYLFILASDGGDRIVHATTSPSLPSPSPMRFSFCRPLSLYFFLVSTHIPSTAPYYYETPPRLESNESRGNWKNAIAPNRRERIVDTSLNSPSPRDRSVPGDGDLRTPFQSWTEWHTPQNSGRPMGTLLSLAPHRST